MATLQYEPLNKGIEARPQHLFHSEANGAKIKPRIIIHGGAGNISRDNLPRQQWEEYKASLLRIVLKTNALLTAKQGEKSPAVDALTAVVYAVRQLEDDPLFNAGVGAVFTREGRVELEASVMVSAGKQKRAVGVSGIRHVRSPVALAAELLRRGDEAGGGGGQGHLQLHGEYVEGLAREWGLDMCDESVFWTKRRWEEHRRGLEREQRDRGSHTHLLSDVLENDTGPLGRWDAPHVEPNVSPDGTSWTWPLFEQGWDGHEYLPQGTVGCVVLDAHGTIAVATSTGGLTNKLPGRVGDTPTVGAGFWAEEWDEDENVQSFTSSLWKAATNDSKTQLLKQPRASLNAWPGMKWHVARNIASLDPSGIIRKCLASCSGVPSYLCLSSNTLPDEYQAEHVDEKKSLLRGLTHENMAVAAHSNSHRRAIAMSGTGNGDSFLKLAAARTTGAFLRFSANRDMTLDDAISWMAGPRGELQKSAEGRWGRTGEGEGGIIGIELRGGQGYIAADFNRGMFRAWIDDDGNARSMVFRDEY